MKKKISILFLFIFLSVILIYFLSVNLKASTDEVPRKLALLVGISDYNRNNGVNDLHGKEDAVTLAKTLTENEKFGFKEDDVILLSNEEATLEGIEKAFREHLIKNAKPGDVVLFYFSGHGEQISDDNGDEMDGQDECLVPYDYNEKNQPRVKDDLLEKLLDELADTMKKDPSGEVQGDILVMLDSCHSGTATKGIADGRGIVWDEELYGEPQENPDGEEDNAGGFLAKGSTSEGYLLISACKSSQVAKEDLTERGVLTYYFISALEKSGTGTTYFDLFERLNRMIKSAGWEQEPQMEGEGNRPLFKGISAPANYMTVQPVELEITDETIDKAKYEMEWFNISSVKKNLEGKLSPEKYKTVGYMNYTFSGKELEKLNFTPEEIAIVIGEAKSEKFADLKSLLNLKLSRKTLIEKLTGFGCKSKDIEKILQIASPVTGEYILIEIPAGKLHGMTEGSVFVLYPYESDMSNENDIIGRSEIKEVYLETSVAKVIIEDNSVPDTDKLSEAKAIEISHNYQSPLIVYIQDNEKLGEELKDLKVINTEEACEDNYDIKIYGKDGFIILEDREGNVISHKVENSEGAGKSIHNILLSEWRKRFLMDLSNDSVKVEVRIGRFEAGDVITDPYNERQIESINGEPVWIEPDENNEIVLYEDEWVTFELRNLSSEDIYITLIAMDEKGDYRSIFPNPESSDYNQIKEENKYIKLASDGRWYRIPFNAPESFYKNYAFKTAPSSGRELVKVIATLTPANFSSLFRQNAAEEIAAKGESAVLESCGNSPLAFLLLDMYEGTRGENTVETDFWGTADLFFTTKKK